MTRLKDIGMIILLFSCIASAMGEKETTLLVNGHKILVKYSEKPTKGTILLLQGWNFPPTDWCSHTHICKTALENGYNLVMPDMGKSIYHSVVFKETRTDWIKNPTRKWLVDTLIVHLQNKFGLLKASERNFIVGLSTGARGAVLIAMDRPLLFRGIAALSGDYDQTTMPNDNLCKGYYGIYSNFKNRWKTIDNPLSAINKLKTPIYLGHGLEDKIVPSRQTIQFYNELRKQNPQLKAKLSTPAKNHDYQYWMSEVDSIFVFFETL